MTEQSKLSVRYPFITENAVTIRPDLEYSLQKQCISIGMDQGFHNYLVYSGQLDRIMDVKHFPQGEGPVNTLGEFWYAVAIVCIYMCYIYGVKLYYIVL